MKKLAALFTAILLLAGCSQQTAVEITDDFTVVTSFYPIYVFTSNITEGAEGVSVQNLTDSDVGCLHNYTVTPGDMKLLEKADLVIINGAGMEAFMADTLSAVNVVDSSVGVELIDEHGEANPHIWLSVPNAVKQVKNITEGLCKADSKNADLYRKNADAYTQKLNALDGKIRGAVKGEGNKNIVTFHEAFSYFAKEYGFNVIATVHTDGESEPGAAQLAQIIEKVKSEGAAAIFTEPQYSPDSAQLIARETDVPLYELDPAATGEMTPDAYERAMEKNVETLKMALNL